MESTCASPTGASPPAGLARSTLALPLPPPRAAPAHDDEYATPATPVPAAYPAPEAYHFPYTSEAVQALRCAACNRTFTSSNAVLQHLRDHAAHKDGPEAQEVRRAQDFCSTPCGRPRTRSHALCWPHAPALSSSSHASSTHHHHRHCASGPQAAYVLQCQEAGLLGDPSAATSPAWGWPHDPQQPYQGTWWWQQQDAQHDGAQAQGAQATGSGSSPSNMSCNEHVDLDEDAAHQQHQHQQQQQQQQGANGFYPPRQPGGQGARGPGVGRRGKPLTGKAGAQQQQQQQQQQRGPGKRPQQLYQPPPPALHTYVSALCVAPRRLSAACAPVAAVL